MATWFGTASAAWHVRTGSARRRRILAGGGVGRRGGGGGGSGLEILHGMEPQHPGLVIHDVDGLLDGLGSDFGMGLFCQFVDIGDGGDRVFVLLIEFDGAKGPVGLEGAELLERLVIGALGTALIAADTVEDGGGGWLGEIGGATGGTFGLDTAEAVEAPGSAGVRGR